MGGPTLLTLFTASELGGSAPVKVLKTTPGPGTGLVAPTATKQRQVNQLMKG